MGAIRFGPAFVPSRQRPEVAVELPGDLGGHVFTEMLIRPTAQPA